MVPALPPGFPAPAPAPAPAPVSAEAEAADLDRAGDSPPAAEPAAALLDRAALLTIARRAGYLPEQATPPPAAPADARPIVSEAAAQRLDRILLGDPASSASTSAGSELLTEWLTALITRGLRPPAQSIPALLQKARQVPAGEGGLRTLIAVAGGSRAMWLAGLNPAWAWLLAEPVPDATAALPRPVPPSQLLSNLPPSYQPGAYLSSEQLADVLTTAMREITRAPLGAHRLIRLAGLWADPALGAPGTLADFPPEAPNVLHSMLAVVRFRYEMLKELDDGHADR